MTEEQFQKAVKIRKKINFLSWSATENTSPREGMQTGDTVTVQEGRRKREYKVKIVLG